LKRGALLGLQVEKGQVALLGAMLFKLAPERRNSGLRHLLGSGGTGGVFLGFKPEPAVKSMVFKGSFGKLKLLAGDGTVWHHTKAGLT